MPIDSSTRIASRATLGTRRTRGHRVLEGQHLPGRQLAGHDPDAERVSTLACSSPCSSVWMSPGEEVLPEGVVVTQNILSPSHIRIKDRLILS